MVSAATDSTAIHLAEEMEARWRQGRPLTEDLLARHPGLLDQPEAVLLLLDQEIRLRREFGPEVTRTDILERFPRWPAQLAEVLSRHGLGEPDEALVFPQPGDTLGEFRLLAELGRGGQGCVFLATQPSLADRPVVVKLTACDGREHLSLARLQHTHIVPLYFAEDDRRRNMRTLCMPYFGSATLKHLFDCLRPIPIAQRTGKNLLDSLDEIQQAAPIPLPARGPARQALAGASYTQAMSWIGACLAEALHYAHERGLVHLDIKPSNVLLAVDGQPMLLDFHLAQKPIHPEDTPPEYVGGSARYMADEQKAAVKAVQQGQRVPALVDGRADVYSLALLLYEALGGSLPYRAETSPPLYRCNSAVSVGLSDIVQKCLAADPAARYAHAGALAADLRRHLNYQPLLGVRNRSVSERWRKWRRRRPYDLPVAGLLAAVLIAAGAVVHVRQGNLEHQREQVQAATETGRDQLQRGHPDDAVSILRHGLLLVEGLPQSQDLRLELTSLLDRAEQAQTRQELARLANRVRLLSGVDFLAPTEMQMLEARCRPFWENRHRILERLAIGDGSVPVRTDLLDLAILWTGLRVRLASNDTRDRARKEALGVLEQAEELFGPSAVLSHARQLHAEAVGQSGAARRVGPPPRTAWEHYALGRSLLQTGDLERAAEELDQALALDPRGFWPNFYQGVCAYRRGQHAEALTAFSVCVGASSESASCFYNRALVYTALNRPEKALQDYSAALHLDPTLAPAALNRGLLHYEAQHLAEAASDFRRALDHGADPAAVHFNLALVYRAEGNRTAALESLDRVLRLQPAHTAARQLQESLQREPE